jgi:hypothetical protein
MLTDRDITLRTTAAGRDPKTTQVREAMTPDVVYCFETASVEDAAKTMQENQIRRLFVLNEEEELVGITSIGELATVTGDRSLGGETLERISQSSEPGPEEHDIDDEEANEIAEGADTRVTGIVHDRETARRAIEELKAAGFASDAIGVATGDQAEQDSLVRETQASVVPAEIMPSFPEFPPSGVLIVVNASGRAAEAVQLLNRHHAVTGGVRVSG